MLDQEQKERRTLQNGAIKTSEVWSPKGGTYQVQTSLVALLFNSTTGPSE